MPTNSPLLSRARAWEERQYGAVTDADLIFRNTARIPFSGRALRSAFSRDGRNGVSRTKAFVGSLAENGENAAIDFGTVCFADGLGRGGTRGSRVKNVEIALLHFCAWLFFTWGREMPISRKALDNGAESKRGRGKKSKSGGSDPTFLASAAQISLWGRSRPSARVFVPDFFPRYRDSETTTSKGGMRWPSLRKNSND